MSQPVATPTPVASPAPAAPAINANMTLAQIDNALGRMATLEDLVAAGIPQQVAQDMIDADAGGGAPSAVVDSLPPVAGAPRAEPAMQPVGTAMDLDFFSQLNSAQSQEEFNAMYDALPAVQQFVYDRSFGQDITPAWAAQKADEFFKSQSEQNNPKAVAETDAAFARAQRAFGATQKIDYAIKRIMGEEDKPRYKSYVGAYSMSPLGLVPGTETRQFQTDLASLKALLGLAAAGETKGQGQVSNYERELYGAASSIGLDIANTEESFKETLLQIKKQNDAQMAENESMLNRLQGKRPAAAGQSQQQSAADGPADTRPRKTLMGTTYAVNADGTLEKVAK